MGVRQDYGEGLVHGVRVVALAVVAEEQDATGLGKEWGWRRDRGGRRELDARQGQCWVTSPQWREAADSSQQP